MKDSEDAQKRSEGQEAIESEWRRHGEEQKVNLLYEKIRKKINSSRKRRSGRTSCTSFAVRRRACLPNFLDVPSGFQYIFRNTKFRSDVPVHAGLCSPQGDPSRICKLNEIVEPYTASGQHQVRCAHVAQISRPTSKDNSPQRCHWCMPSQGGSKMSRWYLQVPWAGPA
ncbi:hypothetical protein K491DRAFT_48282 [Lophiostoma macrostomum CBS 122681]|uniref:Uncharacterized protein n=1 Tax=Lophiostoma macrostomum CBS 122681 TaxID=1314788 RepID=A0A6A6SXG2_9PLEO|nr:hypothetical protein K491DRAFT_48282 [Lophiostoma macrostomum CBS 122681]